MAKGKHKRKREKQLQEEMLDSQIGQDYTMWLFVKVWRYLSKFFKEKDMFALTWILRDEATLLFFVRHVLHIGTRCSKTLLSNGYRDCQSLMPDTFTRETWDKIKDVILNYKTFEQLPQPLVSAMSDLKQPDLCDRRKQREQIFNLETSFSRSEITVHRASLKTMNNSLGFYLGVWDDELLDTSLPEARLLFRKVPTDLVVMRCAKNCNYFYDRSGEKPRLIAAVINYKVLNEKILMSIRRSFSMLFAAHKAIKSRGKGRQSYDNEMKGFGPFHHTYTKGENIISFYTHDLKLRHALKGLQGVRDFENLVDKHSHSDLIEILLGLWYWLCPPLLESLFDYSLPYLDSKDYEQSELESLLKKIGPSAYQLYISKDYCVQMHRDQDASEFSLAYASHLDSSISPINFIIPKFQMCLPISNGTLFAFRDDVLHDTGYRTRTENAAYVGAIIVNKRLDLLRRKRMRSQ